MNHNEMIEKALMRVGDSIPKSTLKDAMNHALLQGGKRLRPRLFLSALEDYGFPLDPYMNIACAIEMIHTYSLIHDDLPAMDDDDLRRGKPTVHKAFDEATAILAGDAMLTDAFALLTDIEALDDGKKIAIIKTIAKAAGSCGMGYGQWLDLTYEGKSLSYETLKTIHLNKTARLIEAPLLAAAYIASPKDVSQWQVVGEKLGLVFQLQDDILEATQTEFEMGKSLSDTRHQKSTAVSLLGLDEAIKVVNQLFEAIRDDLLEISGQHKNMLALIELIEARKK